MPRYYFDVFDGDHITRDEIGIDCRNEDEAANHAIVALRISSMMDCPAARSAIFG